MYKSTHLWYTFHRSWPLRKQKYVSCSERHTILIGAGCLDTRHMHTTLRHPAHACYCTHTLYTTTPLMRAHLVTALPLSGCRSSLVSVSGCTLLVLERRSSCTRGLFGGWLSGATTVRWLRTESLVSLCLRLCSRDHYHKQCVAAIDYAICMYMYHIVGIFRKA